MQLHVPRLRRATTRRQRSPSAHRSQRYYQSSSGGPVRSRFRLIPGHNTLHAFLSVSEGTEHSQRPKQQHVSMRSACGTLPGGTEGAGSDPLDNVVRRCRMVFTVPPITEQRLNKTPLRANKRGSYNHHRRMLVDSRYFAGGRDLKNAPSSGHNVLRARLAADPTELPDRDTMYPLPKRLRPLGRR